MSQILQIYSDNKNISGEYSINKICCVRTSKSKEVHIRKCFESILNSSGENVKEFLKEIIVEMSDNRRKTYHLLSLLRREIVTKMRKLKMVDELRVFCKYLEDDHSRAEASKRRFPCSR